MRWTLLLMAVGYAAAQPVITDLQPRGVQKGRPFTLTVMGRELGEGVKVESTMPATFTPLGAEKGVMGASFLVEPKDELAVGVYPIRVTTPDGISNIQLLTVGTFPEFAEDESRPGSLPNSNDTIESAQSLPTAPFTINGKLQGAERDVFRIRAKAGETRVIEVEARRSGSAIDPAIEIEDASGKVLMRSEDAPLVGLDARLEYTFPKEGFYYIVVRDARYSTQATNFYRLKVGNYLYPKEVFPLGGRRGENVRVSLGVQSVITDLHNTRNLRQTFVNLPDSSVLPLAFAVGDDPEVEEGPEMAPLALPVTINGRVAKAAEVDRYKLQVTPGEWITLRIQARELGTSKLMAVITAYDEKGTKLARAGDEPMAEDVYNVNQSATAGDPELRMQVPAGVSVVSMSVEDLALRGGSAYGYRLIAKRGGPDIRVLLNMPYVNIPDGGSVAVPVSVVRQGFDGPVQLRVVNAPKGLRVEGGYVAEVAPIKETNRNRTSPGVLVLSLEPGLALPAMELQVEAVAGSIVRKAEGPGMLAAVTGATLQGSVDRQRALTAPWLDLQLPAAATKPQAATLEVSMVERKRMEEGDQIMFRWKWTPRDSMQALPKNVGADMVGAADIRLIDAKVDPNDRTAGTFLITTTKLTRPSKYDLYVNGRLTVDGQTQTIVSRPISVEVKEVESKSAAKTDSGR